MNERTYIKNWIGKILDLYYANRLATIDHYEPKMEQLPHELLDMAIEMTNTQEELDTFFDYKNDLSFSGIEEYDVLKIVGDVAKLI